MSGTIIVLVVGELLLYMAETSIPEDTSELQRKTSRDVRCEYCGQRRTVDGYDKPTVAACISGDCFGYFVIPEYPFENKDIKNVMGLETAKEKLNELRE